MTRDLFIAIMTEHGIARAQAERLWDQPRCGTVEDRHSMTPAQVARAAQIAVAALRVLEGLKR
jgi:hypothetical protein